MALILIISFCLFLDDLVAGIAKTKALLLEKANPNSRRSQQEITDELDLIVRKATSKYIYVRIISTGHQMTNLVSSFEYRKVASSRLSRLVAHLRLFRLFMKGKFDGYVL